jgi:MFS family permease
MIWKFLDQGTAPLRQPEFRALWIANFLSNLGSIMHGAAAAWLMTTLTHSPLLIGLVQTAASLPPFLLGLAGGALTDLVNRRRLLVAAQIWMMAMAALMAAMAWSGRMGPVQLLVLLLLLGLGSALHLPGWQTLLQDLVTRDRGAAAVSLNSISFNLARSVGPALGGFLVGSFGAAWVFAINAFSFLAVLAGLGRVPAHLVPPPRGRATPRAIARSLAEGWVFVRESPLIGGILLRSGWFMLTGSGIWALLPVVARDHLRADAGGYGLLLSAFGVGSVLGALYIPWLRRRFPADITVGLCLAVFSLSVLCMAFVGSLATAMAGMFTAGLFWIVVAVNHNVSVQHNAPDWVRGRAISIYLMVFQGALAAGSWISGWLAEHAGLRVAIVAAGGGRRSYAFLTVFFPSRVMTEGLCRVTSSSASQV